MSMKQTDILIKKDYNSQQLKVGITNESNTILNQAICPDTLFRYRCFYRYQILLLSLCWPVWLSLFGISGAGTCVHTARCWESSDFSAWEEFIDSHPIALIAASVKLSAPAISTFGRKRGSIPLNARRVWAALKSARKKRRWDLSWCPVESPWVQWPSLYSLYWFLQQELRLPDCPGTGKTTFHFRHICSMLHLRWLRHPKRLITSVRKKSSVWSWWWTNSGHRICEIYKNQTNLKNDDSLDMLNVHCSQPFTKSKKTLRKKGTSQWEFIICNMYRLKILAWWLRY